MAKKALSQDFMDGIVCPDGLKRLIYFDTICRGLVFEVRQSGGKTYYLRYTDKYGKPRQPKLGNYEDLTLSQVRGELARIRNLMALGQNPFADKVIAKLTPTFEEHIAQKHLPYIQSYKRSWETDVSVLKNHLLPAFGKMHLDEIKREHVVQMVKDRLALGAAPGTANRQLILLRYIYNCAIKWEIPGVTVNPTKGIPLLEENNKKERYLSVEETQRLYNAVLRSENTMLKYIIPMLILTGARKREVLDAKWQDFDLEQKRWRIPMTKSGKPRYVPLSEGALGILITVPRIQDCDYVFANPDTAKPYVSVFHSWDTARTRAGLSDVRIHDLRHSFASLLVNSGRTLYEVQNILGHADVKTTQRYAHLSPDTLLDATNSVSRKLGKVFVRGVKPKALPVAKMSVSKEHLTK